MANFSVSIVEPRATFFDPTYFDTAYFDNSIQTVPISDSLSAQLSAKADISESSLTISDVISRVLAAFARPTDLVVVNDAISALSQYFRSIADPSHVFDGTFFDSTYFDTSSGSYIIADAVSRTLSATVTITEASLNVFDSILVRLSAFVTMIENLSVTDLVARQLGAVANLVETVTESDSVTAVLHALARISEGALSILDSILVNVGYHGSMSETIIISDLLARVVHLKVNITEGAISLLDSVVSTVIPFALKRVKKTVAYIGKRITSAFIASRDTMGDVQ